MNIRKSPDKEIITTEGDVINLVNYSVFWSHSLKSNSKDMIWLTWKFQFQRNVGQKIFWPDNLKDKIGNLFTDINFFKGWGVRYLFSGVGTCANFSL